MLPAPPAATRPRLADHALARRHFGARGEQVILHDTRTGGLIAVGPREWTLLSCADGTRDVDGILLAATRLGAHANRDALIAFLEQLARAGLIADGLDESSRAQSLQTPASRPIDVLGDYQLHCDGRGSCCRIYASIIFTAAETARARTIHPGVLDGGNQPERVFLPVHGSGPHPLSAVSAVNGRCAYLAESNLCSLHAATGFDSKPAGCRLYPVTYTDDGESVRVSVAVECACVLASVGRSGDTNLLPAGVITRGDLDPAAFVDRLPERIALTRESSGSRAELAAWSRAVLEQPVRGDVAATYRALGSAVAVHGLSPGNARDAIEHPGAIDANTLLPWIEALAVRAAGRAREDRSWRSDRDLARIAVDWIADAAASLLPGGACARLLERPPAHAAAEAFHLRAAIHGHHLIGDLPLSEALHDTAIRIVVARAMTATPRPPMPADLATDTAFAYPLALLEAILRGHGLGAYAHDVPRDE